MKLRYRKGIFCVVYVKTKNKIKYLIFKRKLHWKGWEFPKGGLKKGESFLKGIKREIKEETGQLPIKIKKFKVIGKYKYPKKLPDRKNFIGQTYSLYAIEIKKQKINLDSKEHSNYKLVNFEKAIKKLTWPNQRRCMKIIKKWLDRKT